MITILLVRGLSRQQGHWGEFPDRLKQTLSKNGSEVNLVFEDLPGFGLRYEQRSPSSIEKIAELLLPRLERLYRDTNQKVHLLGISMGGMVALELARRLPDLCESLVMINSSVKPVSNLFQRFQPKAYPAVIKAWCHPLMEESERQILNLSTEKHKDDSSILNYWLKLRRTFPPSRIAAFRQIVAASQFHAPRVAPLQKILLIASKNDRIASHLCTVNLANYWQLKAIIHDSAGHDIALDEPEWLAETIVSQLNL